MRSFRTRYPSPASLRRISSSANPPYLRSPASRTHSEHAAIAQASAAWELEVIAALRGMIGKTIPVGTHEGLTITHVLGLAEDETFAGWYNWRGITNPDVVVLGRLVGGPDNGAAVAMAVDAKLSARSGKTQVLTETLAQLLGPFQPLTNLVDSLLGNGASETLVLRNGFHVIRGVATTIDTAAKSTRALKDPEFAAQWGAAQAAQKAQEPVRRVAVRPPPAPRPAPRPAPVARPMPTAPAALPERQPDAYATLFRETVWGLDRLLAGNVEMPEPKGVYVMTDVLAFDGQPNAPVACVILGMHGTEPVAQGVVLGAKTHLPTDDELVDFLATLPAPLGATRYRIVPAFRVVAGKRNTLPVLGTRRTLPLLAA